MYVQFKNFNKEYLKDIKKDHLGTPPKKSQVFPEYFYSAACKNFNQKLKL